VSRASAANSAAAHHVERDGRGLGSDDTQSRGRRGLPNGLDAAKAARHLIQYVVARYTSDLSVAANVWLFAPTAPRVVPMRDARWPSCCAVILFAGSLRGTRFR